MENLLLLASLRLRKLNGPFVLELKLMQYCVDQQRQQNEYFKFDLPYLRRAGVFWSEGIT